LIDTPGNYDG